MELSENKKKTKLHFGRFVIKTKTTTKRRINYKFSLICFRKYKKNKTKQKKEGKKIKEK